jgi:iron(III) transport system permease protein
LVVVLLLLAPLYLQASAWQAVWGLNGWLTERFGLPPLSGWPAVIWIQVGAAVPWVVVFVWYGLSRVEPELEEDALLDGSPLAVFWKVSCRRSLTALVAAAIWIAGLTAGDMTVTNLYQKQTLAEVAYLQYARSAETEVATSNLLLGTLAISAALAVGLSLVGGTLIADRHSSQHHRNLRLPIGKVAQRTIDGATWLFVLLLVGVPWVGLVNKAGIVTIRSGNEFHRSWSALGALKMVGESPYRFSRELSWSLLIGAVAATLAVLAGFGLAWIARHALGRACTFFVIAFTLMVPGPLIGIGVIALFHGVNWAPMIWLYDDSIAAPVLAQSLRALPLTTLLLWPAVQSVPQALLDSAAVDGAGRWATWRTVVVPLVRNAIAAVWLVALAIAIGDLAATILVVPPGVETLSIHLFGLIHFGVDDRVAGITLAMILMIVCVATPVFWRASGSRA